MSMTCKGYIIIGRCCLWLVATLDIITPSPLLDQSCLEKQSIGVVETAALQEIKAL